MIYPYYQTNSMYMQDLQAMRDRIDQQMRNAQQYQSQMAQTPQINQTFQIAPNQSLNELEGKYVNNIEEVKNTLTLKNTLFVDKEMKNLWFKGTDGNIKTYTLSEVVELDEKDKQIILLQRQIEEMRGMMLNAKQPVNDNVDESVTNTKSTNVSTVKSTSKK